MKPSVSELQHKKIRPAHFLKTSNVSSSSETSQNKSSVREILVRNVDRKFKLMTDESRLYTKSGEEFNRHQKVSHSHGEYIRGGVFTNTLEGYYSIFKRGMNGTYHHCDESYLQRYVTEFDFRYNGRKLNDNERRDAALRGIEGKRLRGRLKKEPRKLINFVITSNYPVKY